MPVQPTRFFQVQPSSIPSHGTIDRGFNIAKTALSHAAKYSLDYSLSQAPTSTNPLLTGNRSPGVSRLTWLIGRYKCNQFVGDVLNETGIRVPMFRMGDGSYHYINAEKFAESSAYFRRIADPNGIRLGDLVLIDYPNGGENGAHLEIVTNIGPGVLGMTGAHADGAYERDYSTLFGGAQFEPNTLSWQKGGSKIIVLRSIA